MSRLKWIEPSEKEIENAILYYLNAIPDCFAFKVNTMGVYDQQRGFYRRLSRYVLPGTPDIIACVSVDGIGVFVGFEVKTQNGRQSGHQKEFEQRLKDRAHGFYFIVKTVKETEDALKNVRDAVGVFCGNL